ncbi:MAG: phosphatidylglycerophosphatase A [Betaproteobacteria bacterium]|nr:phosphatidylglycerophosphatase A [Betaproteobacteria bacterium]
MVYKPSARFAASHPAHMIAFGFGAGLVPFMPGTAGTLLAWPIGWFLGGIVAPKVLFLALAVLFVVGVWACGLTGRRLGMPDYGGMVWDEFVAFLLVLAIVPRTFAWQLAAFLVFRAFDMLKPPPIRWFERRYHGGFGVMFDDLLAAGYTVLFLALIKRLFL